MFFKLLKDALKVKNVRNKIFFTLFIILVFRIGTHITVPGINVKNLEQISELPFLNMLNLVSGNAMGNFSVFSMGVSPYITASIIVQLLQMDMLPKFVEWSKQGEVGRRKLNQATRYISLVLAFIQSIGITALFNNLAAAGIVTRELNVQTFILIGILLATGSMIVTWLGEQISDKGFGNGVSMIIFSGIISSIPSSISTIYEDFFVNVRADELTSSYIIVGFLVIAVLAIVFFTTFVQQAEYKIPIQYTKLAQGAPTSSYLPLKINPAGVIPVIFASSVTTIPSTIIPLIQGGKDIPWLTTLQSFLNYQTPVGMGIYALLIILFSFFYTFVQVNPEKTAENLQKSASYIPSVRPGRETEDYMSSLLKKLATVGSLFLAFISLTPIIAQQAMNLSSSIALGGTSLLILISTGIEGMKQLEGYLLKRKYAGFMNTAD